MKRLHSVVLVVEDIDAMVDFFIGLGFELDADASFGDPGSILFLVPKTLKVSCIELLTPLGESRIELLKYQNLEYIPPPPPRPGTITRGLKAIGVLFDDLDTGIERALSLGATFVGEGTGIVGEYRLAYVLGPENVLLMLGEERPWW